MLDLCCGTGQIARLLLERGYTVTGVDSSAGMLAFARRNAPAARLVHADARSFAISEPADAAISTSDSLNHVIEPAGLASVFTCVRRALRAGGRFVFDMNTEEKYRLHWTGSFGIAEDDHACIVRASYDPRTSLARFDATLFLDNGPTDGAWTREDLVIMERCYTQAEILAELTAAGFRDVGFYDWRRDIDPEGEPGKFFVVCQRE